MATYASLRGSALDASQQPLRDLSLALVRRTGTRRTELERVFCDEQGGFVFDTDFGALGPSDRLEVLAYQGTRWVSITNGETRFLAQNVPDHIVLEVEPYVGASPVLSPPAQPGGVSTSVRGRVAHADGNLLAGITVKAYQRNLAGDVVLELASVEASDTTDSQGGFAIGFDTPDVNRLVIKAFDGAELIGASRVAFAPQAHQVLDITVTGSDYRRATEWSTFQTSAAPLITGTTWGALDQDGIDLIAGTLKTAPGASASYVAAKAMDEALDLPVDAEVIYGLVREGAPADIDDLIGRPASLLASMILAAADGNRVSESVGAAAEDLADDLRVFRITRSLADLGPTPLGGQLELTSMAGNATKKESFVTQYLNRVGSLSSFWENITGFTAGEVLELQRMIELGRWSYQSKELLEGVNAFDSGSTLKDIASLTSVQWTEILTTDLASTGDPPTIPAQVDGETLEERRVVYIERLRREGERRYPSAVVRQRALDTLAPTGVLAVFLEANPDHDFNAKVTDEMVAGSSDPEELAESLKLYQRLYRIGPRFERFAVIAELLANDLHSAWLVAKAGQYRLEGKLSLEPSVIAEVVNNARQTVGRLSAVVMQLMPGLTGVNLAKTLDYKDVIVAGQTEIEFVFDDFAFCQCKECRSLLSPAAYLVDLLAWEPAHDLFMWKLQSRRGDIAHLKLSCENTHTPLPYIDLVLEVLENAVHERAGYPNAFDTGTATAEELAANPKYVNGPAYDDLRVAVFPPTAPFDYFHAQADVFLAHVGIHRADLMETFQNATPDPTDVDIAAVRLGLSPKGYRALTAHVSIVNYELWGFSDETGTEVEGNWVDELIANVRDLRARAGVTRVQLVDLMASKYWNPAGAFKLEPEEKCDPDETTMTGSPTDDAFVRLMQFIRAWRTTGWTWLDLDIVIQKLGWISIDDHAVEELARLVRLLAVARQTLLELLGWWGNISTREDRLLADPPTISLYDRLFLRNDAVANLFGPEVDDSPFRLLEDRTELFEPGVLLEHLPALQAAFGVEESELLLAIQDVGNDLPLDLATLSAVYRRILLARAISGTIEEALGIRDLQWLPRAHYTGYLGNKSITEMGSSPSAGDVVIATGGGAPEPSGSDTLALGDVAEFYEGFWRKRLAAVEAAPPPGTRLLVSTSGTLVSPLSSGDKGKIGNFDGSGLVPALNTPVEGDLIRVVRDGRFDDGATLAFAGVVPSGSWSPGDAPADPFADLAGALAYLKFAAELKSLSIQLDEALAISVPGHPAAARVLPTDAWMQAELGALRDAVVATLPTDQPVDPDGRVLRAKLVNELGLTDGGIFSEVALIMAHLGSSEAISDEGLLDALAPYLDSEIREELYDAEVGGPQAPEARFSTVLRGLNLGIAKISAEAMVTGKLAQSAGLEPDTIGILRPITFDVVSDPDEPTDVVRVYLVSTFLEGTPGDWSTITRETQPAAYSALDVLIRLGRLRAAFKPTYEEFVWWVAQSVTATPMGLIELTGLASERMVGHQAWRMTISAFAFRDRLPGDYPSFAELMTALMDMEEASAFLDLVEARTGWPADQLQQLVSAFDMAPPDAFALNRLAACVDIAAAAGADLGTAYTWRVANLRPEPEIDRSEEIVASVRGKYTTRAWYGVARPIRDALRERQRAALVEYLIATTEGLTSVADVHGRFLLDPEMSSCMLTSRVTHAIGSVQLLVQRHLLGLEDMDDVPEAIGIGPDGAAQWEWMKQYRIWEAARKVFLYPENYVEPELRDDKSHAFQAFEDALAQGEVGEQAAESAYEALLLALKGVARLEVVAILDDYVETNVVGRTLANPRAYYHRKRLDTGHWTPWTPIAGVGETDLPVLTKQDGRLRLFYLTTRESREGEDNPDQTISTLEWTEHTPNGWSEVVQCTLEHPITRASDWGRIAAITSPESPDILVTLKGYFHPTGTEFVFSTRAESVVRINEPMPWDLVLPHYQEKAYYLEASFPRWEDEFELYLPVDIHGTWLPLLTVEREIGVRVVVQPTDASKLGYGLFLFRPQPFVLTSIDRVDFVQLDDNDDDDQVYYRFRPLFHPFIDMLVGSLRSEGVWGVLAPTEGTELYKQRYKRDVLFDDSYEVIPANADYGRAFPDAFNFNRLSPYAEYNWEVFFHAPLAAATRLSTHQQFAAAQRWMHAIFEPTNRDGGESVYNRPWQINPFTTDGDRPVDVRMWAEFTGATGDEEARGEFDAQVTAWRKDPFDPHLIAKLRPGSYQRATIFKYLDNLIAWADQLFRRDTMETVSEATQLYLMALQILGERPEPMPLRVEVAPMSFHELKVALDSFNNPMIRLENLILEDWGYITAPPTDEEPPDLALGFYFCVPQNEKALEYWDTVDDRLFKIRSCLDIEGRRRSLPLFAPPIDPMMLVRAAAAGVSVSDALSDLAMPLPPYRFASVLQRARSLVASLDALGNALLQAMEKRDAEELALLRSTLELDLQAAVRRVREDQIESARLQRDATRSSRAEAELRRSHYNDLIQKGLLPAETRNEESLRKAHSWEMIGQTTVALGGLVVAAVPSGEGFAPSWGGKLIGAGIIAGGTALSMVGTAHRHQASIAALKASTRRRVQDWRLQVASAERQLATLDKQIEAADATVTIAERELENHDRQLENLRATDEFIHRKFTNQELYQWMVAEIGKVYFQVYDLAHAFAKKAQRCYRHELAIPDATFIVPGHWDSLKKGLLAGSRLQVQLDAMDAAYLDHDRRELELVKHVSLRAIDPVALLRLVETSVCYFELSEVLFDLDVPGGFLRRLRSVSVTMPGVTGPYVTVNARLTLHSSKVRWSATGELEEEAAQLESIVTSGRPDDAGLFQFDFGDPRYHPFERRGAVSAWGLELTSFANPSYDPRKIEDVVITIRYTARDDASGQRAMDIEADLDARTERDVDGTDIGDLPGLGLSVRSTFPDAWHALMTATSSPTLTLPIGEEHFPYLDALLGIKMVQIEVLPLLAGALRESPPELGITDVVIEVIDPATDSDVVVRTVEPLGWTGTLDAVGGVEPSPVGVAFVTAELDAALVVGTALNPEAFQDIIVVIRYTFAAGS